MKHNQSLLYLFFTLNCFLYSTETVTFWKELKFWNSDKQDVISLNKKVPNQCKIEIHNVRGNICIKPWKQSKIMIEARKNGTEKAIEETLIKADICPTTKNFTIETSCLNAEPCKVDYDILIPESASIQSVNTKEGTITFCNSSKGIMARTEKGDIKLDGVTGEIKTSTTKGSIEIYINEPLKNNKILAIVEKGNIKVSIPKETNAQVYLKTTHGSVKSDIPITLQPMTIKYNSNTLAQLKKEACGTIGEGGEAILKLHTSNGNIKLVSA
ncbi:hypothetical protein EBU95_15440 [bacterium]|nr:hypothetical protein [bacterium]